MDGISESITPIKIKEEDPSVLVGEFGLPSVSWLNIQHFGFFTLFASSAFSCFSFLLSSVRFYNTSSCFCFPVTVPRALTKMDNVSPSASTV